MSNFGNLIGKLGGKFINAINVDSKYYCQDCNCITEHITISYTDMKHARTRADGETPTLFGDVCGTVADYVGFANPVFYGNPYACTQCTRISLHGGITSRIINQGWPPLYLK